VAGRRPNSCNLAEDADGREATAIVLMDE
jgi:hypothetical protein